MNLIRTAIDRPSAVIAVVLMVVMFGIVALQTIPIQLAPDVNRPVITVTTNWPGAAPAEVEREITIRQEEVLKGIGGLSEITSTSEQGRARIRLEFAVGTPMDRALLLVSNRLDRVTSYPEEADEPNLKMAGAEDNPIAWFIITRVPGNEKPIHEYGDFVEDVVKDRIERVIGIGEVTAYGGSEREIEVVIEPSLLARYGLTVAQVLSSLRRANAAISAGDVDEGKRRYVVRTEAELNTLETVRNVVLRSMRDPVTGRLARVVLSDVANIDFAHKEPTSKIRLQGEAAIAFNATRETGANVIETMAGIDEAVRELSEVQVPSQGLKLVQVYDETVYINSSVQLVRQNIWVGGTLAAIVLLLFLRSWRATLIVSLAIPVSVIGSFVAMAALGRSLNVISLAGIAFAVGMVVDAAIVVLENIYRFREAGKSAPVAAYEGTKQVWGAVLVSALTTVMVFIPILIMQLEVGQLFRDIAVAISVSVLLSLVVSITVLPALASRLLADPKPSNFRPLVVAWLKKAPLPENVRTFIAPYLKTNRRRKKTPNLLERFVALLPLDVLDRFAAEFVDRVVEFTKYVTRDRRAALIVVSSVSIVATLGAWAFLPKLEYLPDGNRNLMFGIVLPPPGYNLETTTEIAKRIESKIKPFWKNDSGEEAGSDEPPKIDRFFFVATRASTFLGAAAVDPSRAHELKDVLAKPVFDEPGTFAIINQLSIFASGLGGGRKIELDVSGPELEEVLGVALQAAGLITTILPLQEGNQFRPNPGLELGAPEVRVTPNRMKLADNGVTARELGEAVDTFNDGLRVVEVTVGNDRLDLMLKGPKHDITSTQGVANLPVVTEAGQIVPVSSMADVTITAGPTQIRHRERRRTVTLEILPKPQLALEEAIEKINSDVIAPLRAKGLPPGVKLQISGTADKLSQTWNAMVRDLIVAIIIVFLVMAILFESFIYPLIILLSVPLAAAGGVAGLVILNIFSYQPLDMLTLLGFVILIGIVVNNAILLVHQTLIHLREDGMSPDAAIIEATRNRIRPIFMSTLTSVFGMLPLVLIPGAGSELYRGLGSVVVGGLSFSALLTLLIVPPMLTLVVGALESKTPKRMNKRTAKTHAAPAE